MTDFENLRVRIEDGVGHLTIDSTSAMNALNPTLVTELHDAAVALGEDDAVRAIAITGTGGVYNAGADLSTLDGSAGDAEALRHLAGTLHDAIVTLHGSGTPIVTGVNGVAAGAGFGLAIMGDIVLVSDEATLEFAYPRIGLVADGASTFFLPRLVGQRRAMEIVLRDEPIDPGEAVDIGLATEVVEHEHLDERLADVAGEIAQGPTVAHGLAKELLFESYGRTLAGQLAAETEAMTVAARTDDWERGHAAFFEDGDPDFVGE